MTTEQLDRETTAIGSIAAQAIRLLAGASIPPRIAGIASLATECEAHESERAELVERLQNAVGAGAGNVDAQATKRATVHIWARAFGLAEAAASANRTSAEFSQFELLSRDRLRAACDATVWRH